MSGGIQGEPTLLHQTLALLRKNLLLKWRRKWHTFLELVQNLAFVFLMFLVASLAHYIPDKSLSPALSLGKLGEPGNLNFTVGYMNGTGSVAGDVLEKIRRSSSMTDITFQQYEKEEDLADDILNGTSVGLVFQENFKYQIQFSVYRLTSPNHYLAHQGFCSNTSVTSCVSTRYWYSGFLLLQATIDSAIMEVTTGKQLLDTMKSIKAVRMRSLKYTRRTVIQTGTFITGMCMCYVSLTYLLSQYVSRERHQMRETMRMMKLRDMAFWLSWGLFYTVYILIIANLMTLVVKTFVFVESSYGVILLLFALYGLASVSFCFMLTALFKNPRVTAIVGFFVTLFLSVFSLLLLLKNLPKAVEVLLSVFPPFAFAVGVAESVHLENDAQGVFFMDIMGDSSHILSSCISLTLDTIFYFILTLYFDKVLPDKYGKRHNALFFLKSSFWRREKRTPPQAQSPRQEDMEWGDHVERVPSPLIGHEAIRISNVKKTYVGQDRNVEALRGLDFDVYDGQITALLGHNGAGKTTLLNILSGMCKPTSGSASIYGYNLSEIHHSDDIHHRTGFCPQFDVHFEPLTVKENLKVFCHMKGIRPGRVNDEVQRVISDLQLDDVQNLEAGTLSGGQKRRLTLGIAILGDPQVLLLDEPTAGLDPCSRHQVWKILEERKGGRVTLLSTQFMDEADILADRKAVISAGRLRCLGSSLFLKRKWGIGYHLRMEVTPSCDPETIATLIGEHISNPKITAEKDQELTITLPFQDMAAFPGLFSSLEDRIGRDVVSFGVSMTTLDDVFLKLEGEADIERGDYGVFGQEMNEEEDRGPEMDDSTHLMADSGNVSLAGRALWRRQVVAVARIRFLKLKHDTKSFRAILLLLLLFMIPFIVFVSLRSHMRSAHTWELRPDLYFLKAGDKEHKYFSRLLICNNTGSPIEDFTDAVTSQNIVIDVADGPFDVNTSVYRGAIEVSGGAQGHTYTVIGNPRAINSLPVLVNIISNAQLRILQSEHRIRVWSDPVSAFDENANVEVFYATFTSVVFAAGMAPHFAMSSIEDTKIRARPQLHVSGLFPSAFWCGQALIDLPLYWLLLFLITAILFLFNHAVVLDPWLVCVLISEILGYGAAMILYVYVIAFILRNSKSHPDWWSFLFIMVSALNLMVSEVSMYNVFWNSPLCSFVFPPTGLTLVMQEIAYVEVYKFADHDYDTKDLLTVMIISYTQILLFSGTLWCLEWRFGRRSLQRDPVFRTSRRKLKMRDPSDDVGDEDEEVVKERERVKRARSAGPPEEKPVIMVENLQKEFPVRSGTCGCRRRRRVAARSVSFCVQKGEVLGLLGPNGAGKTTAISMLAGELDPSAGEVELSAAESGAFLGYCPQESPLWPHITVQEHLEVYAAIKGMERRDAGLAIQRVAEALDLGEHLSARAGTLSAGVSRKVCFALGMLGNPTIVLLDEPSTGLDPKGRHRVWRAVRAAFRNTERGAILTTHYMEEAEAVCDRIAIMVSGKLRCVGSLQQLKTRFGKGYVLEMKVKDAQRSQVIQQKILQMFPQAVRQERFSALLVYKIPMEDVQSLSRAFSQLEEVTRVYGAEEYSLSQSTLEQVFLDLVKEQETDDFQAEKRLQSESA